MRLNKLVVSLQAAGLVTAQPPIYKRSNATDAQSVSSGSFSDSPAPLAFPSTATTTPSALLNNETTTTFETKGVTETAFQNVTVTAVPVVNGTTTTFVNVQPITTALPMASSTAILSLSNQTTVSGVASSFVVDPVTANARSSPSAFSLTLTAKNASSASVPTVATTVITSDPNASAVQVLSPTTQTITRVATTTDYFTVNITETAYIRSTEYMITVTEYTTKYVTASLSALAPLGATSTFEGTACATGRTVVITLPASMSPTIVAIPGESLSGTTYTSIASSLSLNQSSVAASGVSTSESQQSGTAASGVSASSAQTGSAFSPSEGETVPTSGVETGLASTTGMLTGTSTSTSTTTRFTTVTTTYTTNGAPTTLTTVTPERRAPSSSSSVICNATATSIIRNKRPHPTLFCNNWNAAKPHATSPFGKLTIKQVNNACGCILAQPKSSSSVPSSTAKSTSVASYSTTYSTVKTTSSTWTTSTKSSSSSVCSTVTPPAPTQTGIISGCTQYYVAKTGDYCYLIADKYNLDVDTFMTWNPAVNAPSCNNIQIGEAYCVARGCSSSGTSSTLTSSAGTTTGTTTVKSSTTSSSATSTSSAVPYKMYTGNGTVAAGWPSAAQWVDFDTMFTLNQPIMLESCENNWQVPNDSTDEIANLRSAILDIGTAQSVDPRFILAIIMQESNGCVRVITTSWGVTNPGLMQSHDGNGTCNEGGVVQSPCPQAEIYQMVEDGTAGTSSGDGLSQCLAETGVSDVSRYYRAARIYNGGVGGYNADDLGKGCCTLCYATDVANRLTGWSTGTSKCTL